MIMDILQVVKKVIISKQVVKKVIILKQVVKKVIITKQVVTPGQNFDEKRHENATVRQLDSPKTS